MLLLPLPLRAIALALAALCLATAAKAQSQQQLNFYCNSSSPQQAVSGQDFVLFTRPMADTGYPQGLQCEFNAESATFGFFVDVQSMAVKTAMLTISSDGRELFRGSRIQAYQRSITTPSRRLQIRFNAIGDFSRSAGVTIRVRELVANRCPPGWVYMYDRCVGTSNSTGRLNITDAQKACNSMRANLLIMPNILYSAYVRALPKHLTENFTWIGMTDRTSEGRFQYFWLDGLQVLSTREISCFSSGTASSCFSYERCAAMRYPSGSYAIFMGSCDYTQPFACSMPLGGTDRFYQVPDSGNSRPPSSASAVPGWVWGVGAASVVVVAFLIASIQSCLERNRTRVPTRTGRILVTAGRVITPSPPRDGAAQPPQQPQPVPAPQYSKEPPTYEEAVSGGYVNSA